MKVSDEIVNLRYSFLSFFSVSRFFRATLVVFLSDLFRGENGTSILGDQRVAWKNLVVVFFRQSV